MQFVALVFALIAAGLSGYGMVETKPNLDSLEASMNDDPGEGKLASIERDLLRDYKQTLGRLVVGSWAAGLIAVVLGTIALKKGAKGLGALAIIIGLAGGILGGVIMPQPLVL